FYIKGAGVSTGTDEQGNYQLKTTGQNPIFAFSGLGYAPQEIVVGQDQVVHVTMRAMVSDLEEVVVVGYGTQRRADVTGSIAVVKMEDKEKQTITNASQALYGTSGVWVNQAGSKPGDDQATIRIRGVNTL